jgi:hypothetical protein
MSQMADTYTKYMFELLHDQQFEVRDNGGPVRNGATDWRDVPLQGDMMKFIWNKFVSDAGLVTNPGANIFMDGDVHSAEELTGLLNLLLFTTHPEWEADLANSSVPQLRTDLCYFVN